MKLYNTQTKKIEEIKPHDGKVIRMYVCGPTVYNFPHIGNYRTYINTDFLRRSLLCLGYKVKEVMNITDIEDKIIRDSKKQGISYKKLADKYEKVFFEDIKALNLDKAEFYPHATDEKVIGKMIEVIESLIKNGNAYVTDDGVYFSIKGFKGYGKLSGINLSGLKKCERVASDEYEKENPSDFALWKFKKENEPSWPASFGEGRPGWHIECTAMNLLELGETIDIHAGAVDLIFPHHENEIAQTETYSGKPFVLHWFHPEHLLVEGERMGKSIGNFYVLSDLKSKFKVEPLALRFLSAQTHYRERLNFTAKSIQDAQNALDNLRQFVLRLQIINGTGKEDRVSKLIKNTTTAFKKNLASDLSIPSALADLFEFIKAINIIGDLNQKEAKMVHRAIIDFDEVLGFELDRVKFEEIPEKIIKLVKLRETARKDKDFKKSDELRDQIEKSGYTIEDTQDGPLIRKK